MLAIPSPARKGGCQDAPRPARRSAAFPWRRGSYMLTQQVIRSRAKGRRRIVMRKFLILASLALALGGCVPVATPAMGVIFTEVKWTVDGENQGSVGSKEGKACAKVILGMVAQGDA